MISLTKRSRPNINQPIACSYTYRRNNLHSQKEAAVSSQSNTQVQFQTPPIHNRPNPLIRVSVVNLVNSSNEFNQNLCAVSSQSTDIEVALSVTRLIAIASLLSTPGTTPPPQPSTILIHPPSVHTPSAHKVPNHHHNHHHQSPNTNHHPGHLHNQPPNLPNPISRARSQTITRPKIQPKMTTYGC